MQINDLNLSTNAGLLWTKANWRKNWVIPSCTDKIDKKPFSKLGFLVNSCVCLVKELWTLITSLFKCPQISDLVGKNYYLKLNFRNRKNICWDFLFFFLKKTLVLHWDDCHHLLLDVIDLSVDLADHFVDCCLVVLV